MSNLRPEQRVDKNGTLVTRHVKDGDDTNGASERISGIANVRAATSSDEHTDPRTGEAYPASMSREDIDDAVQGMAATALFSSTHYDDDYPDGIEMDSIVNVSDISDEQLEVLEGALLSFAEENEELVFEALSRPGYTADDLGGDLWYTANGHGTGFWDREPLEADGLGEKLTEASHRKTLTAYVNDDGNAYFTVD